jgi:hypothetical protein
MGLSDPELIRRLKRCTTTPANDGRTVSTGQRVCDHFRAGWAIETRQLRFVGRGLWAWCHEDENFSTVERPEVFRSASFVVKK